MVPGELKLDIHSLRHENRPHQGIRYRQLGLNAVGYAYVAIHNNIVMDAGTAGITLSSNSGGDLATNVLYNNVVDYGDIASSTSDIHADPLLDASLRLTSASPAINAGTDHSALFQRDIDGDPRAVAQGGDGLYDIGADEYCPDADGDGFTSCGGDCNDADAAIKPDATEVCDGVDNDCDDQSDEGLMAVFYRDADGDTFGNAENSTSACSLQSGYVTNAADCNDLRADSHPGGIEVVRDNVDQDCNGYDLTIVIGTATWSKAKRSLQVDATSLRGAGAGLQLQGYGPMTYSAKKALWSKTVSNVSANPLSVTVSGPEGSVTSPVTAVR